MKPSRFLPLLLIALSACTPHWTRLDQPTVVAPNGRFTLAAPKGWVQLTADRNAVVLTRDGLAIQFVEISQLPSATAFAKTKTSLAAKAPVSEVADALLAERRALPGLANLEVVDNTPATVAGSPGFRIHYQFRNDRGARYEGLTLGTQRGEEVLQFNYVALANHLYTRDLPVFEGLVASYAGR